MLTVGSVAAAVATGVAAAAAVSTFIRCSVLLAGTSRVGAEHLARNLLADRARHALGDRVGHLAALGLVAGDRPLAANRLANRVAASLRAALGNHLADLVGAGLALRNHLADLVAAGPCAALRHHLANLVAAGLALRHHLANLVAAGPRAALRHHAADLVAASLALRHHAADLVAAGLALRDHLANLVAAGPCAALRNHAADLVAAGLALRDHLANLVAASLGARLAHVLGAADFLGLAPQAPKPSCSRSVVGTVRKLACTCRGSSSSSKSPDSTPSGQACERSASGSDQEPGRSAFPSDPCCR